MPTPRPWIACILVACAVAPLAACVAWRAEPAAQPGHEMFAAKDADGDGQLSPAELARGLAPMPEAEARHMFALLDRDQDGRVGLAEYYPDPASVHAFGFTSHQADESAP